MESGNLSKLNLYYFLNQILGYDPIAEEAKLRRKLIVINNKVTVR